MLVDGQAIVNAWGGTIVSTWGGTVSGVISGGVETTGGGDLGGIGIDYTAPTRLEFMRHDRADWEPLGYYDRPLYEALFAAAGGSAAEMHDIDNHFYPPGMGTDLTQAEATLAKFQSLSPGQFRIAQQLMALHGKYDTEDKANKTGAYAPPKPTPHPIPVQVAPKSSMGGTILAVAAVAAATYIVMR